MSNRWASVSVAYRGVEEELGRILAPFFVAPIRLIFSCTFVEGSGVGGTGSRVLLIVAIAAVTVKVGSLGIE
jgi:hypothetical protein